MSTVYNMDLVAIVQRLDRFKEEVLKSVSSASSEMNEFDLERLRHYLSALSGLIDWCQNQPQLDLCESHPTAYEVPDLAIAEPVESEIINDIVRILDATRQELVNSQSARKGASLISFDEGRVRALILKLENFLDNFVEPLTPLDLPESSPQAGMTTSGRKGT